ncbi:MAG TPA: Clp protease N-terminal domain-containing protein [Acidimicrobiales bacterium]|nr:Clp protease N-terminal domain-containing protein [Acidimicrobiales bacterium]
MFERFTDRSRRLVVLAQEEARLLHHDYIGTEHLLLGLLAKSEGLAARALVSCDVHLDAARAEVVEIVGRGASPPSGHIPFTERAKATLERSLRESLQLGHNYIGTEHILLGLLADSSAVAVRVLDNLRIEPARVRERLLQLIADLAPPEVPTTAASSETTVFVVPGRTVARLDEVVRVVHDLIGRAPVVLHRQPRTRRVIGELFEEHPAHARAAVVLLSGDDVGGTSPAEGAAPPDLRPRAHQDLVYELGWFHGRLGRYGVVVLVEEGVETPGDIGVPYITLDAEGAWRDRLAAGLSGAGLRTDPGSPA